MINCGKRIVCIRHNQDKSEINIPEIAPTKDFDFAAALEAVNPLLEIVLDYLNYKELKTAAQVKKTWQDTVDAILEKRCYVSWFSLSKRHNFGTIRSSLNFPYNNIHLGIVFFNNRSVSLSDYFCIHDNNYAHRKIKFSDYLLDELIPDGIEYCVISCSGLGSIYPNHSSEQLCTPLFDCCFIPHIPHVEVKMFPFDFDKIEESYQPLNTHLKCLFIFGKEDYDDINALFKHLLPERNFQNVALGGGTIKRSLTISPENPYKLRQNKNFCIAFSQHDNFNNFNAFSCVLNGRYSTPKSFEDDLIQFKNKIKLRKNSIGFRIRCSGKHKRIKESRLFNNVFPTIPLIGFDVEGEIGWDCFSNTSEDSSDEEECQSKKQKASYPVAQHQWSTVFVILTWGKLIN